MPRGSGIYEDQPREHKHRYSPGSTDDPNEGGDEPPSDDLGSKQAGEPTG